MEFAETLEILRAKDASISRLFGGDGRSAREVRNDPRYRERLARAVDLVADVQEGKAPMHYMREAMTTGDFPLLFADIIDRQMMGSYTSTTKSWPLWAKRGTVPDFRLVSRFSVDGAEAALLPVPQGDQYPERTLTDTLYQYRVGKYGSRAAFAWETMINDDFDALKGIPERFGRGAGRAEEKFATGLIADTNGPHATMFSAGNKNQVIVANGSALANPVLGIPGLQNAMVVLAKQVDKDNEPIVIDAMTLVVPPALELPAQNIVNAAELWITGDGGGGTAATQLHVNNWMRARVRVAVDSYLPIISTVNGQTSWYLFASPENGRAAVEIGFLRGHENPETFMKAPDQIPVTGGAGDAMDGDFDTDAIQYKVRHVFGGTRLDPKMAVASNGTGV